MQTQVILRILIEWGNPKKRASVTQNSNIVNSLGKQKVNAIAAALISMHKLIYCSIAKNFEYSLDKFLITLEGRWLGKKHTIQ